MILPPFGKKEYHRPAEKGKTAKNKADNRKPVHSVKKLTGGLKLTANQAVLLMAPLMTGMIGEAYGKGERAENPQYKQNRNNTFEPFHFALPPLKAYSFKRIAQFDEKFKGAKPTFVS